MEYKIHIQEIIFSNIGFVGYLIKLEMKPENQYDSLQECLGDDTKMVEYTTRDGWCNSWYVLIKD